MKAWELREKHDTDIHRILLDTGCIDQKGRVRRWVGKLVIPALEARGHSSCCFDSCCCRGGAEDKENLHGYVIGGSR